MGAGEIHPRCLPLSMAGPGPRLPCLPWWFRGVKVHLPVYSGLSWDKKEVALLHPLQVKSKQAGVQNAGETTV